MRPNINDQIRYTRLQAIDTLGNPRHNRRRPRGQFGMIPTLLAAALFAATIGVVAALLIGQ